MSAPHEIAAIVDGVARYKPGPERLARFLATRDMMHLELENGQRVVVRPLPEERRWRTRLYAAGFQRDLSTL